MTTMDRSALPHRLRQLVEALDAAGWTIYASEKGPGIWRADHPRMNEERPTPDHMRGSSAWPFDTFTELRQVWFSVGRDNRLDYLATRTGAPWVGAAEHAVSLPKALAFIVQEWPS